MFLIINGDYMDLDRDFDWNKIFVVLALLVFAGAIWWQDQLSFEDWGGVPRVVDGDSLEFPHQRVRLKGIDAPEGRQTCERAGKSWRCGRASQQALRLMIGKNEVQCSGSAHDRHDRLLAYCKVGALELNRAMVRDGWAVSYGGEFLAEERAAKAGKRGLWEGTFQRPVDWRRANPR